MQKINFVDLPSRTTPINATNLNAIQTNAENAINEAKEEVLNVELIAVTDTAPATCSTGDKYYNTTTDLIYTATGTNTWGSTGESAVDGIMYIVYSKKSTYAYDGETLISVGGGSGAYIGTTEPPADDNSNVWIDPNGSVNVYGNYISNSYGTSQEIGYSQEYVNNVVKEVYSTNEVKTNKVDVDGKPIYRKVFTADTFDMYPSTSNNIIHGVSNLYRAVSIEYSMYFDSGHEWYTQWDKIISKTASPNYIKLTTTSFSSTYTRFNNVEVYFEYTKTD